ncbi:MAG: lysine exporter LysO family protein [Sphaerochaetaceae bacterium]|nr:lysine exporter LysO family protein [Sphaerochaetaceae bacterium]MDC7237120.1 lysine exporter LysO family protein [Sphaerochaetaceae bacterium]
METILYLSKLIFALVLGVIVGKKLPGKMIKKADILLGVTLYILLFFMGINTGSIENILSQLNTIGVQALLVTVFSLSGTILVSTIASFIINTKKSKLINADGTINNAKHIVTTKDVNELYNAQLSNESKIQLRKHRFMKIVYVIKEPLILVMTVILGMLSRLFTPFFDWYTPEIITYLLYVLLFFSGLGIINSKIKIKEIFDSPILLLLPIWTIIGTYLGALILALISDFTISQSLGLSSGFGWYSLSGIMITDLGYPILGSISFLSNIFRESFSFFLIPLFSKFGRKFYYPSVCIGGATTMDVTLPIITSHFGTSFMIPTMYHGIFLTLVVPFLIPLFF